MVRDLRPSPSDAALRRRTIPKLLVRRPRAWPAVRILVRADSGFRRWERMNWCARNDVLHVTGPARDPALRAHIVKKEEGGTQERSIATRTNRFDGRMEYPG